MGLIFEVKQRALGILFRLDQMVPKRLGVCIGNITQKQCISGFIPIKPAPPAIANNWSGCCFAASMIQFIFLFGASDAIEKK